MRQIVFRGLAGVLAAALLWGAGFLWFATALPSGVADPETHTDAIVVLTGGSERFGEGIALLEAGLADRLFLSGVGEAVTLEDLNRVVQAVPAHLHHRVVLGHAAMDTAGNAAETAEWIQNQGYRSLRLVTAAYHMPRSLMEFRQRLPRVTILPHPVFPEAVKQDEWWRWGGTARLVAGEYTKFLAAGVRHLLMPSPPPVTGSGGAPQAAPTGSESS